SRISTFSMKSIPLNVFSSSLQQVVEVDEAAKRHRSEQREQHKPAPGWSRVLWVKRVGGFEHSITYGFAHADVFSITQVLAQRSVNRLDALSLRHLFSDPASCYFLAHQKRSYSRLLALVQIVPRLIGGGKLKTQDRRMWARCQLQGHHPNDLPARGDAPRLQLPIQHLHRSLLFDLEFGYLLITKLRVNQSIEGLRGSHPVQLVDLRRVDAVRLRAVIPHGVTDQQAAILLIQVADPHLQRLRGALLVRQHPNRLSREQQFRDRWRNRGLRSRSCRFHRVRAVKRGLVDGEIH